MVTLSSLHDAQLTTLLRSGAVGIMPTDTIYGLVASATDSTAVNRLYSLKNREQKPGTVIAASIQQLAQLGLDPAILAKVAELWPNSISIVLPAPEQLDYLDQNVGSLAVRIPNDANLRQLLEQVGPLVTTSANHPGETPANTVAEAQAYFDGLVDFYVDGGDRSNQPPSTVVRWNHDGHLKVLRQGAIAVDQAGRAIEAAPQG